jgi:hypothetical protein
MKDYVVPSGRTMRCGCGGDAEPLLMKVMESGHIAIELPAPGQIRERCQRELARLGEGTPVKDLLKL